MGIVYASSKNRSSESSEPEVPSCLRCTGIGSPDPGNPGSFQDIHKKVKDLYPLHFEGAKLTITKKLSNHFRVDHTLTLSTVTPAGYTFGASYEGTTMIGDTERYPSLKCRITPNGNQSLTLLHALACRYRIKIDAQIADRKYESFGTTVDYRSDNCTLSLTMNDPSFVGMNLSGSLALHFLQAVSSRLALGVEIATQRNTEPGYQTILAGAARYSTGPFTVSATIGDVAIHACCHRRASEQLEIGAEIEINYRTLQSQGTIVYQLNVPEANLVYRGMIDSACTVSAVLEKKLSTIFPSLLLISGTLNHKNGQFRVGVGLNVGWK